MRILLIAISLMLSTTTAAGEDKKKAKPATAAKSKAPTFKRAAWNCFEWTHPNVGERNPCHPSLRACRGDSVVYGAAKSAEVTKECYPSKTAFVVTYFSTPKKKSLSRPGWRFLAFGTKAECERDAPKVGETVSQVSKCVARNSATQTKVNTATKQPNAKGERPVRRQFNAKVKRPAKDAAKKKTGPKKEAAFIKGLVSQPYEWFCVERDNRDSCYDSAKRCRSVQAYAGSNKCRKRTRVFAVTWFHPEGDKKNWIAGAFADKANCSKWRNHLLGAEKVLGVSACTTVLAKKRNKTKKPKKTKRKK